MRRSTAAVELAVVAIATFAVYALLWSAQRASWSNGLDATTPSFGPRPHADLDAGRLQTTEAIVLGVLACALFAWTVIRARRWADAGFGRAVLAIPVVVAVGLLLLPPSLSSDAYSYLSHGWLAAVPGHNPYVDDSSSVGSTAYGRALLLDGWQASHPQTPYGPVWTAIERAAYTASGSDVALGVVLVKLPVVLAVFGTAALIHAFLRRTDPAQRLRGCLLYLANPLILVELAGDGHNDGLMAAFVVLAALAALRRRAVLAIVAVALAVLVKSSAAPFALPVVVHLLAQRRSWPRAIGGVLAGGAAALVLAVVTIAPYWAGSATLDGVRASGTPGRSWAVASLVNRAAEFAESGIGRSAADSAPLTQVLLLGLLLAATVIASVLARTPAGLLRSFALLSFVVLLLLPLDWPWYAVLPASVLPLVVDALDVGLVGLLALTSRITAPIGDAVIVGSLGEGYFFAFQAFVGQTLPSAIAIALLSVRRGTQRLVPPPVRRLVRALTA